MDISEQILHIKKLFESTLPDGIDIDRFRTDYNSVLSQMYLTDYATGALRIAPNQEAVFKFINLDSKLKQALTLAYSIKHQVDFYDLICVALIIPNKTNRSILKFLHTEIIQTTKDTNLQRISLNSLQKYTTEDIEKENISNNSGINPEAIPLIDNFDKLNCFISDFNQSIHEIEIGDVTFNGNSIDLIAYSMDEVGFCRLAKSSIKITIDNVISIKADTQNWKELTNGILEISTQSIDSRKHISCSYIHAYQNTPYFVFIGKQIIISDYRKLH